jgi:CheY-like chemotaxis protein
VRNLTTGSADHRKFMKILVVNDEPSFSDLITRAIRRLGHVSSSCPSAREAIRRVRDEGFDAVIAALELPDMDGIELAAMLRTEHDALAIGFSSGANDVLRDAAARVGRVLPRVWTVATLKDLLNGLDRYLRKLATGTDRPELIPSAFRRAATGNLLAMAPSMRPSAPSLPAPPQREVPPVVIEELPPIDDDPGPDATAAERPRSSARLALRKVRLSCRSWDQVERLCAQHSAGKTVLTLRGPYRLHLGEPLVVALALPDELVLSLRAEVIAIRDESGDIATYAIGLAGLTDVVIARLESMAAAATGNSTDLFGRPTRPLPRAKSEISFA